MYIVYYSKGLSTQLNSACEHCLIVWTGPHWIWIIVGLGKFYFKTSFLVTILYGTITLLTVLNIVLKFFGLLM